MRIRTLLAALAAGTALVAAATSTAQAPTAEGAVRVATFNASLNRSAAGQLAADLADPANAQARAVAEIIQRANPDVILINEFDYDRAAVELFIRNFLAVGQNGAEAWEPVAYFIAPSNTGVGLGIDLDRDGNAAGPGDTHGFGFFEGQYGMLVLSKLPIVEDEVRTFQNFLWADMPGALLPDDAATPAAGDYYPAAALEVLRLSSKSHWDIPVEAPGGVVHILASHPTPPVFDGPEDRNGRRNADEVRFWLDYVTPGQGAYIYDDAGVQGGLDADAYFVIVGDLNLDPNDGDGMREMGQQLLASPRLQDPAPRSEGGPEAAVLDGGKNAAHTGDPALDTANFADARDFDPGNLRADYVLPSAELRVAGAGVFWPLSTDPLAVLLGPADRRTSDHHLVFVDVMLE